MAHGGVDHLEVSRLTRELQRAQNDILKLREDNERLQVKLSERAQQEESHHQLQKRLALLRQHMFGGELFADQDNLNLDHKEHAQQELLPDGEHEDFQNLEGLLLDGEEEGIRAIDAPPAPTPEENQEPDRKRDLNIETMDNTICVFCDAFLRPGTESSHYGSCPEYSRWSGEDGNDSFFYQQSALDHTLPRD